MNKSTTRSERSQSSAASLTQWICKPVYWAKFNPNDPNEVRRIANWSVEGSGLYCGNLKEDQARLIAAAPLLFKELDHLLRLLEPLEQTGSLPAGLATLNGSRAAIAQAKGK